jgi:hypothetical protein
MAGRRTSWTSLAFGLIFIGVGVLLLTSGVDLTTRLHWAGPILLVIVALCLIASALGGRARPAPSAPPVAPSVPPAYSWGGAGTGPAPSAGPASGSADDAADGGSDAPSGDAHPDPEPGGGEGRSGS